MTKRIKLNGYLLLSVLLLLFVSLTIVISGMTFYKNSYVYNNLVDASLDEGENSDRYLFDTFYNVLLYKNSIFSEKNMLDFSFSADKDAFIEDLKEQYLPNEQLYFDVALLSDDNYYSLNKTTTKALVNPFLSSEESAKPINLLGKIALNDTYVGLLNINVDSDSFFFFLKESALIPLFLPSYEDAINLVCNENSVLISTDNSMFSTTLPENLVYGKNQMINNVRYIAIHVPLKETSFFTPIYMISLVTYNSIYGTIDIAYLIMVILAFLVTLIVGLISVHNINKIVSPIKDLSAQMKTYKQADNVTSVSQETNEVFELEQSFQEMVDRIETLIAKQEEDSETKRKLELESLQTQINPHFLYNALDSIAWMSKISHNKNIEDFIILLAKFYRLSLHKGAKYVTIAEEMDIVKFYLSIQSKIFPNLYVYETYFDEDIGNAITLKLILQPLVENAIKYAFHSYDVKGKIIVRAVSEEESIVLSIVDNGRGFNVDELFKAEKENRGFGIKNVRERLKLEYEGRATFEIHSTLNEGTTIKITIPKTF